MKVIEQYIIKTSLIIKTENGNYYRDGGRGYYEELTEKQFLKIINQ
jgi:hypothetical protein